MFNRDEYGRILVPMVTPFKDDQSVDYVATVIHWGKYQSRFSAKAFYGSEYRWDKRRGGAEPETDNRVCECNHRRFRHLLW